MSLDFNVPLVKPCSSPLQEPEKEVSDWLSDLTLADQHAVLEVRSSIVLLRVVMSSEV